MCAIREFEVRRLGLLLAPRRSDLEYFAYSKHRAAFEYCMSRNWRMGAVAWIYPDIVFSAVVVQKAAAGGEMFFKIASFHDLL